MTEPSAPTSLWARSYPGPSSQDPELSFRPSFRTLEGQGPSPAETIPLAEPGKPKGHEPLLRRLAVVGEGGMGTVYRARQEALKREVALKASKGDNAERFLSEALVTAYLDHPNIVPVYELQADLEGRPEIAMKLVSGRTWSQRLSEDRPWEDPRALDDHLEVLLKVCDAVAFAHVKGIVHLDLKPDNVMLGDFNEVLVLDWGLAHEIGEPSEERRAPATMELREPCGTPRFMPPELALGQGALIDERSDVYLLGGLLHVVLTGAPPHRGEGLQQVIIDAVEGPPPRFSKASPAELGSIATRALSKERAARFAGVAAFAAALRSFRDHRASLRLTEEARAQLAADDEDYDRLRQALSTFEQARALWSDSPEAAAGIREAHRRTAVAALAADDLALARSHILALGEGDGGLAAELARAEDGLRRGRARQAWTRRGLAAAVLIIAGGLTFGTLALRDAAEEARQAEADAETRRAEAARSAEEARGARVELRQAEAEVRDQRTKADSALAESRRNLAQVFAQAGRVAFDDRDGSAELRFARSLTLADAPEVRGALARCYGARLRLLKAIPIEGAAREIRFDAEDRRLGILTRLAAPRRETRTAIAVFDPDTGDRRGLFEGHSSRGTEQGTFAFWPERSSLVVLCGRDLVSWSLRPGAEPALLSRSLRAGLRETTLRFSPDGRQLAVEVDDIGGKLVFIDFGRGRSKDWTEPGRSRHRIRGAVRFPIDAREFLAWDRDAKALRAYPLRLLATDDPPNAALPHRALVDDLHFAPRFLAASRDGRRFVYQEPSSQEIVARDAAENRELCRLPTLSYPLSGLTQLSMSADGGLICALSETDPALRVWRADGGALVLKLALDSGPITAARFGRRRPILAVAAAGRVLVYDLEPLLASARVKASSLQALRFAPEGRVLAFEYSQSPIIARVGEGRLEPGPRVPDRPGDVFGASTADAEARRFAMSTSGGIELRSARHGDLLERLPSELDAYLRDDIGFPDSAPRSVFVMPNAPAAYLRYRSLAKREGPDRARAWLADSEQIALRRAYGYRRLRFSPEGLRILALGVLETHLWTIEGAALRGRFPAAFDAVFLSEDRLACLIKGKDTGALELRELGSTQLRRIALAAEPLALAVSADRSRFAIALADKSVELWSAEGRREHRLPARAAIQSLALDAAGSLLVLGLEGGRLALIDAASGALIGAMSSGEERFSALGLSPDGRWLLTSSWQGLRCWPLPELLRAFNARPEDLLAEAKRRLGLELDGFGVIAGR